MELGEVEIVDVRDSAEWTGGHVPGARHVSLEELRQDPESVLGRDGILFVCAAGVRSQTAARLAQSSGFQKLYNLSGGTRGWVDAGLPLVSG